jgi:glucosylceramidase
MEVRPGEPLQTIGGFGGAFSEKGWDALRELPEVAQGEVLDALFAPGAGANFSVCRTPIGANDISRGWYSYDETPGDFSLEHFSVKNDQDTLIPFIQAALKRRPDLRIWASPWSPPTWMKTNHHYAMTPAWPGQPSNGLRPDQAGQEGHDYFIQEERYFEAYARYFRRYVEEYSKAGIRVSMVMPQNEFNSAQPFPSCCWTPQGLARFIPKLARELGPLGVEVFFGTLERGNPDLVATVMNDPEAKAAIRGIGVQWAGKGALPYLHERYPGLPIWGTEQECGTGANDWRYARYAWGLMRQYFQYGTGAWLYWNMVLPSDQLSGWGWPQNSLVTIDLKTRRHHFNPEYHLLRHTSHFVAVGARYLQPQSYSGFDNGLAFLNPDGALVLVLQNELCEPLRIRIKVDKRLMVVRLPGDSFNTVRLDLARI